MLTLVFIFISSSTSLLNMAFSSVREDVLKLFQDEDLQKLIEIFSIYSKKWINSNKNVFLNTEQLYAVLSCGEIGVNEDALNYLPASVSSKNCVALRSESSGNCLFSSISLCLVGDNSLTQQLRLLACIELFVNSEYYSSHPNLFVDKYPSLSPSNILAMSVSHAAVDTNFKAAELVKAEATFCLKNMN
ncbi:uncharacterized protein LOC130613030 [Hydractinia symbiolongicarpus]|uniref:uncharacterized protein LOC130612784 n=1 Tax=Hydractinia symbiolongicarpus TaxID=13093 RepID=UPI002550E22C|nr:uncharacterized protein LOC130612784 [Hydractinia symbiolongicarpus]XP_057290334.1 uncharacterized protein LOC130613030 [Hydractinia symbiolongicarpus]